MENFKNLPTDILLEIITRLPIDSILHCKLVCNQWRNLVSNHPSFSRLHLTRHHDLDSGKLTFLVRSQNQQLHYIEYTENNHDDTAPPTVSSRMINLTPPFATSERFNVLGSFNGLVCLQGWKDSAYCICNPVTKHYFVLPKISRDCADRYVNWSSGFGYLCSTDEYKVVELYKKRKKPNFMEVAVYTLGSGDGWRNVGRFDTEVGEKYGRHGVFVNGVLHWVDRTGGRVFALDLTEEKFEFRSPPRPAVAGRWHEYAIGVFGGVLYHSITYYCRINLCTWCDIWLLEKKNAIPEMSEHELLGWSKEFSFSEREPLAFTHSGEVLCYDNINLYIYDQIASTSKYLVYYSKINQVFPHKNTLISLKGLGEVDIKVMESSETRETEAMICRQSRAR